MQTQVCSIDPQLVPPDKSPQAKQSGTRRRKSTAAKAAHAEASRKYREKHEDELREQARIRMAQHRAAIKATGEVSEERAAGIKNAHATYHAKRRDFLAFKQRLRRQEAFLAKHGQDAYRARCACERAKADAAADALWRAQVAQDEANRRAARQAGRSNY